MYCLYITAHCEKSLPRFHAQCIMLSTNFEQNLSLLSFSFDTFDRPLKYRSLACYFDKVSKRTFCEECNNLVCTRDKTQARQFGSAKFVSSSKHCKIHVHTVRKCFKIHLSRLKRAHVERNSKKKGLQE